MRTAILVLSGGAATTPVLKHFDDVVAAKAAFKQVIAADSTVGAELWLSDAGRVRQRRGKPARSAEVATEPQAAETAAAEKVPTKAERKAAAKAAKAAEKAAVKGK